MCVLCDRIYSSLGTTLVSTRSLDNSSETKSPKLCMSSILSGIVLALDPE